MLSLPSAFVGVKAKKGRRSDTLEMHSAVVGVVFVRVLLSVLEWRLYLLWRPRCNALAVEEEEDEEEKEQGVEHSAQPKVLRSSFVLYHHRHHHRTGRYSAVFPFLWLLLVDVRHIIGQQQQQRKIIMRPYPLPPLFRGNSHCAWLAFPSRWFLALVFALNGDRNTLHNLGTRHQLPFICFPKICTKAIATADDSCLTTWLQLQRERESRAIR